MIFISPLKVFYGKCRQFIINLNQYRNKHYRILNQCKENYKETMKEQIKKYHKHHKRAVFIYTVHQGSNRRYDIGNVCCIHQKFFEDAFVELGKMEDDNCKFIPMVIYVAGEVDPENPRVEIEPMEINDKTITHLHELIERIRE